MKKTSKQAKNDTPIDEKMFRAKIEKLPERDKFYLLGFIDRALFSSDTENEDYLEDSTAPV